MKISQALIQKIIAGCDGKDDMPRHLAEQIEKLQRIVANILAVEKDEKKEVERHMDKMASLEDTRRANQKLCQHLDTTYCGDPSGGSDSSTTCNICGAEL